MTFAEMFHAKMIELKNKHGHGAYSWTEGMTRKIARRIARDVTRQQIKAAKRA